MIDLTCVIKAPEYLEVAFASEAIDPKDRRLRHECDPRIYKRVRIQPRRVAVIGDLVAPRERFEISVPGPRAVAVALLDPEENVVLFSTANIGVGDTVVLELPIVLS